MLSSPTYLHLEGTGILTFVGVNVIAGMVLQIMEKPLIQNTTYPRSHHYR
jgi:hypothetical protein